MGSYTRIVGQKFLSEINNGSSFSGNTSDFSLHLKGGVLEKMRAEFTVQVGWDTEINQYTIFHDLAGQTLRLEQENLNFRAKGFSVGDSIKISINDSDLTPALNRIECDITAMSVGEISCDNVNVTHGALPDGVTYIVGEQPDIITGLTTKTALDYRFGLIENDESFNTLSKLTNTDQIFLTDGIGVVDSYQTGVSAGNNKAWVTGEMSCAFLGLVKDRDFIYNEDTTQEFKIIHEFTINPFYRDGEIDSLTGEDTPPIDIYQGDLSLKYVFQTEFRTTLNNPNTSNISQYDTELGSVGYFDESLNGFKSNYTVDNVEYTIDGNTAERLDIGKLTHVEFDLKSTLGTFTSSTPFVIGNSGVQDSSKYLFTDRDPDAGIGGYDYVWADTSVNVTTNSPSTNKNQIKNLTSTLDDSETIHVSFDIEYFNIQKQVLEGGQYYLLYFIVGDETKTADEGSKVTGRIDVNIYDESNDVEGLHGFDVFEQYPHPEPFEEGVTTGFTEALTFNESGMMADGRFWVLNGSSLNDLKFDIAVYKFDDDSWDSLRSLVLDLSDQVVVNGIQQIELDTTRGYILKEGDIFNYLKITTDNNDGTKQYYNIQVGYRMPWQSWLEFKDAPETFYDKTKSYNGLNQKASNYSMVGTGVGANVFTDADNGTFDDGLTTNMSVMTTGANQIGTALNTSAGIARTGAYGVQFGFSSSPMTETSKFYTSFKNDTGFSVTEGDTYEIASWVSLKDINTDADAIDKSRLLWLPTGYTIDEVQSAVGFEIVSNNLYSTTFPSAGDWIEVKTTFKAKATTTLTFEMNMEIYEDINALVIVNPNTDDITFKNLSYEYGIKVLFDATVDSTRYVTTSEEIKVYDYEEDDQSPTNFTCSVQTYGKDENGDDVALAGNIIKKGYTEFRSEFTPLVPPTFTSPVDMTEVATSWGRFAHGNKCSYGAEALVNVRMNGGVPGTGSANSISPAVDVEGTWANDQAGEVNGVLDSMQGLGYVFFNKDTTTYTSTATTIQTDDNIAAFYGCVSTKKYEYYEISGKMFSESGDDDAIGYVIAYDVDENGIERTLSLVATTGGLLLDKNPSYVEGDITTNIFKFASVYNVGWALVYNFGKSDMKQLDIYESSNARTTWATLDNSGEDFNFTVRRSADEIEVDCSWVLPSDPTASNTFTYNLTDEPETNVFRGFKSLGFAFLSQNEGGFRDVNLTRADGDYYVEHRIDPKESQSDFADNRISSHIEAAESGILTQITGDVKKATLSFDGTKFVGQCLIDTDLLENGQDYDFSAELRPLDLEE